jgi:excinuclease UvrABC ATPase subunit
MNQPPDLHFDDVKRLLGVLNRLVEKGNTVLVIEHNLDVIKSADWVIDLGPEGGDKGGEVVAVGTPEEVAKVKEATLASTWQKGICSEKSHTMGVFRRGPEGSFFKKAVPGG